MRPLLVLALLTRAAHGDPIDDAIGVLHQFTTATIENATDRTYASYGLARGRVAGDVPVLKGCARLTGDERANVRARIDGWVKGHTTRGRRVGRVEVVTSCQIAGETYVQIEWNELGPGPGDDTFLEFALFRATAKTLTLVEAVHKADQNGALLHLTSAGDLDGDGKLDIAFTRRRERGGGTPTEIVVRFGNGNARILDAKRWVGQLFFDLGDARGVVLPGGDVTSAQILIGAVEGYRFEHGKFTRDPAIDQRLLDGAADDLARREAAQLVSYAARCTRTKRDGERHQPMLADAAFQRALDRLTPPAAVAGAAKVLLRERRKSCHE